MRYATARSSEWWSEDARNRADALVSSARSVERVFTDRLQRTVESNALYGSRTAQDGLLRIAQGRPLRENVIAQYVDTFVSQLAESRPRPMWVPIGGDSHAHRCADLLLGWFDHLAQRESIYAQGAMALRDAVLCGLGCLRPYRARPSSALSVQRVDPLHIVFDDAIGTGIPDELYLRHPTPRHRLRALYPEHAQAIDSAPSVSASTWYARGSTIDAVEVWEAWHLPSSDIEDEEESDGTYVLAIAGQVLVEHEWRVRRFPLAFVRAVPPVRGFWGDSLTLDRAAASQEEHSRMLRFLQQALHVQAVPRVFVERSSAITKPQMDDEIGAVLEYTGRPPIFMSPPALSGDVYAQIDQRKLACAEAFGVSQLAAMQLKPAGLDSGEAIRAYEDTAASRQLIPGNEYSALYAPGLAQACVDLERARAREEPTHRVPCGTGQRGLSTQRWSDIDMVGERAVLTLQPTGLLPTRAAGRLNTAMDMAKLGLIQPDEFFAMLGAPDIERVKSLASAPRDAIAKALDDIISDGIYHGPMVWMNFAMAKTMCLQRLNRAWCDGAAQTRIEKLERWYYELHALEQRQSMGAANPFGAPLQIGASAGTAAAPVAAPVDGASPAGAMPPEAVAGPPPMGGQTLQ